jgi:hypothetical protein
MYRLFIAVILLTVLVGSTVVAETVVLVGSGAPDPIDALLIEFLEGMGFTLRTHSHAEKHPVDLTGVDVVFISESTTSGNILGAYTDSTVPVVNCETWTYDDMGFAAADGGFSDALGDTLKIVNPNHPITQGFPEQVQVYDPAIIIMTANNLEGDVDILAVRADNEADVAISVYEKGAETLKGATEAIHVNIYPHSTGWANVTADGWKLIENSIHYAMGRTVAVQPAGKLAVRWADVRCHAN